MATIFPTSGFEPGSTFEFEYPKISTWQIQRRLSEHSHQLAMQDLEDFGPLPSSAEATFMVQQPSNPNGPLAYMRVYLQVPHHSTEFDSPEARRRQADRCPSGELKALKFFHEERATMTPPLLGVSEKVQTESSPVPGGFVVFIVFEMVHGIRLGGDSRVPLKPGVSLPRFFRKFNRAERDEIRESFSKGYATLARLNYIPPFVWADRLIWDSASSKLWLIDFRGADEEGEWPRSVYPAPHRINYNTDADKGNMLAVWGHWGLAYPPEDRKLLDDIEAWHL